MQNTENWSIYLLERLFDFIFYKKFCVGRSTVSFQIVAFSILTPFFSLSLSLSLCLFFFSFLLIIAYRPHSTAWPLKTTGVISILKRHSQTASSPWETTSKSTFVAFCLIERICTKLVSFIHNGELLLEVCYGRASSLKSLKISESSSVQSIATTW